jgi:hypothetical protein
LHHRVDVLIEHGLQASPIAARAVGATEREDSKRSEEKETVHCGIVSLRVA